MTYNTETINNKLEWTIDGLVRNYNYDRQKLSDLFYKKFSDKQIGWVRYTYHQAFVDNVEGKGDELKEMLDEWL